VKNSITMACTATLALAVAVSGCAIVNTTATVVKTGASVAGTAVTTTASVAKAAVDTTVAVGSATVAAGGAAVSVANGAKSLTLATASVAISGAALVGSAVMWGIQMHGNDEYLHAPVTSGGGGSFVSAERKLLWTQGCEHVPIQAPGVLVATKSGVTEVRVNGDTCPVLRVVNP
jgi:hypothetical protein